MIIAVIETNDIHYQEHDRLHTNFTQDKIQELLSDYIQFLSVSSEELLNTIMDNLIIKDDIYTVDTKDIGVFDGNLYQICHIQPSEQTYDELKKKKIEYNGIASYLSDYGLKIYGKAVVIKTKNKQLCSLTLDDLSMIYKSKFVHKGLLISSNNEISETEYIFNPIDWIKPDEVVKYKYHEIAISDEEILMIFFDTTSNTKNEKISALCGQTITGTIILGVRKHKLDLFASEYGYIDLNKKQLEILLQKK